MQRNLDMGRRFNSPNMYCINLVVCNLVKLCKKDWMKIAAVSALLSQVQVIENHFIPTIQNHRLDIIVPTETSNAV